MKEQEFLEKLRTLKEQAVLQGGFIGEAQIEESFPGLDEKQKGLLSTYFKENHIGIGEALPEEELLSPEEGEVFRIYMDELEELYRLILRRGDCLSLKSLAVSGDDLIAAGMEKGPAIGTVLQKLLDEVLRDPELNKRDKLLLMAGGFAAEIK